MQKIIFFGLVLTSLNPCFAALSPFYQGMREINEVLKDPYLKSHVSQAYPIEEIKLVENTSDYRVYSVTTKNQTVVVTLTYKAADARMGPRQYTIEWETLAN